MKPKHTHEASFISRVEHLVESTRPSIRHGTPVINSKLNLISSHSEFSYTSDKSFYEKYSKIWSNRSFPKSSISFLCLLYRKLSQKYLNKAWAVLSRPVYDPLSFTFCTKCGNASLTLLTSSTQDRLSPRFIEKVKMILPKGKKVVSNCKSFIGSSPRFKPKSTGSVIIHPDDPELSPEHKMKITDLSEIAPNPYFLSSLSSPEQIKDKRGPRDEISFDVSRDSYEVKRETSNLPKQFIPKLRMRKCNEKLNEYINEFRKVFQTLQSKNLFWAFSKLSKPPSFPKPPRSSNDHMQKMITNSKKTAFKILHSRLEKFLFRRKMQGFYSISEILYR